MVPNTILNLLIGAAISEASQSEGINTYHFIGTGLAIVGVYQLCVSCTLCVYIHVCACECDWLCAPENKTTFHMGAKVTGRRAATSGFPLLPRAAPRAMLRGARITTRPSRYHVLTCTLTWLLHISLTPRRYFDRSMVCKQHRARGAGRGGSWRRNPCDWRQ